MGKTLIALFVGMIVGFLAPKFWPQPGATVPQYHWHIRPIVDAISSYELEYGALPIGDQISASAKLFGENEKKIHFLTEGDGYEFSEGRGLLDQFGHPYEIIVQPDHIWIRSGGRNGKAYNWIGPATDDIIYYRQTGG